MPHAPDLSGIALDGRYELHAVIGEGSFGRVYRGRDRRLGRLVAVKVIKPWWADDPEWVSSFQREAQLLASVNGAGIVQIFDVGSAPEGLYYVAELVDGESLATRLGNRELSVSEAHDIAEQLAWALAQAHQQHVVHRDVKPANVLIAADGRVKIGDFGVARLAQGSSDVATATVLGTPRYMAPEQAQGGHTSPATDVYGMGVVLYEMLAGRPPFAGSTAVELAVRHLHDRPPPLPPAAPPSLARVVERALAKEPEQRYPDGRAMALALAQARTVPRMSPRRDIKPARRRKRGALVALAGLIALGMLAAAIATAGPQPVSAPRLVGSSAHEAAATLHEVKLRAGFTDVPSPGARAGTVTRQSPAAGSSLSPGSTIRMWVAEAPRWRRSTSLAGEASGRSVRFRILGRRWRISTSMSYEGTCTFIFVCSGPSATVSSLTTGATIDHFNLSEGSDQTRAVSSGPGFYRITISTGSDSARWAVKVDDYY